MLPQLVNSHALKYENLELKSFEQNFKTFMHILYISIFYSNNSIVNYIYITHLNS